MNVVTMPLYNPLRRFERLADELLGIAEAAPSGPAYDIRSTGENSYSSVSRCQASPRRTWRSSPMTGP